LFVYLRLTSYVSPGEYSASGVFTARLSSAPPSIPRTPRGPILSLAAEKRHRNRIAAARHGIMTARGQHRERAALAQRLHSSRELSPDGTLGDGWEVLSAGLGGSDRDSSSWPGDHADDASARSLSVPSSSGSGASAALRGEGCDGTAADDDDAATRLLLRKGPVTGPSDALVCVACTQPLLPRLTA